MTDRKSGKHCCKRDNAAAQPTVQHCAAAKRATHGGAELARSAEAKVKLCALRCCRTLQAKPTCNVQNLCSGFWPQKSSLLTMVALPVHVVRDSPVVYFFVCTDYFTKA